MPETSAVRWDGVQRNGGEEGPLTRTGACAPRVECLVLLSLWHSPILRHPSKLFASNTASVGRLCVVISKHRVLKSIPLARYCANCISLRPRWPSSLLSLSAIASFTPFMIHHYQRTGKHVWPPNHSKKHLRPNYPNQTHHLDVDWIGEDADYKPLPKAPIPGRSAPQ